MLKGHKHTVKSGNHLGFTRTTIFISIPMAHLQKKERETRKERITKSSLDLCLTLSLSRDAGFCGRKNYDVCVDGKQSLLCSSFSACKLQKLLLFLIIGAA